MPYCIICKNIVKKRYKIKVNDSKIENGITGYLCRDCYNRFLDSYHNKGVFKISGFLGWAKIKDRFRN